MKTVWHYTTATNAGLILACGEILPARANVPAHEKPAVWFSRNQDCEPTALKAVQTSTGLRTLSMEEQSMLGGLVRIGLPESDSRLIPWHAVQKALCMSPKMQRALEQSGRLQGANPQEWFVIPEPVSTCHLIVEHWSPEYGWARDGGDDQPVICELASPLPEKTGVVPALAAASYSACQSSPVQGSSEILNRLVRPFQAQDIDQGRQDFLVIRMCNGGC